jgi:phage-related protein
METLPSSLQWRITRQNLGDAYLWLVKIAVTGQLTQYAARNVEAVTYNGQEYPAEALEVDGMVRSGDGGIPEVRLQVSRLNEVLYQIVRNAQGAYGADVQVIKVNDQELSSQIAALEFDFELQAAQADSEWIYFTLGVPNPLQQAFPLLKFDADICPYKDPGRFKGPKCQYAGGDTTCDGTLEDCRSKSNQTNWGGEAGMDQVGMRA